MNKLFIFLDFHNYTDILIGSDPLGLLQFLENGTLHYYDQLHLSLISLLQKVGSRIHIIHVKGHRQIQGNQSAAFLANVFNKHLAIDKEVDSKIDTYKVYKSSIQTFFKQQQIKDLNRLKPNSYTIQLYSVTSNNYKPSPLYKMPLDYKEPHHLTHILSALRTGNSLILQYYRVPCS